MENITLDQIRTGIREEFSTIVEHDIREGQKGLNKLLEAIVSDVSELKDSVANLEDNVRVIAKSVRIIANHFTHLDKLSSAALQQLEDIYDKEESQNVL